MLSDPPLTSFASDNTSGIVPEVLQALIEVNEDADYGEDDFIKSWDKGTYVGEFKNGKPNGQGTYTYAGERSRFMIKDYFTGEKKIVPYSELDKYVGGWKDGKSHGHGTTTFLDGRKHVGEYKNGQKSGQGTLTYPDGGKYVGEWKDGKKNGKGKNT